MVMTKEYRKLANAEHFAKNMLLYNLYRDSLDEKNNKVSLADYKKISDSFLKFLFDLIIDGESVELPNKLGEIYIRGRMSNIKFHEKGFILNRQVNWAATKKLWTEQEEHKTKKTLVYFLNDDTQYLTYKFCWLKLNATFKNKGLYTFTPIRSNDNTKGRSKLTQALKNGKEYIIKTRKTFYNG